MSDPPPHRVKVSRNSEPAPAQLEARANRIRKMQEAIEGTPSSSTNTKRVALVEAGAIDGPSFKRRDIQSDGSGNIQLVAASSTPAITSKDPHKVFLRSEQQQIFKLVLEGKYIFFTGSAGAVFLYICF